MMEGKSERGRGKEGKGGRGRGKEGKGGREICDAPCGLTPWCKKVTGVQTTSF